MRRWEDYLREMMDVEDVREKWAVGIEAFRESMQQISISEIRTNMGITWNRKMLEQIKYELKPRTGNRASTCCTSVHNIDFDLDQWLSEIKCTGSRVLRLSGFFQN